MSRVIVTKEIAQIGMSVMRGKDWIYGDQDGEEGNKGIIRSKNGDYVVVKWEGKSTEKAYRIGHQGKFDLYIYVPTMKKEVRSKGTSTNVGGALLSHKNVEIGMGISLYTSYHPYGQSLRGDGIYHVRAATLDAVYLEECSGLFEMKYFCITEEASKPMCPFAPNDIVYLADPKVEWVSSDHLEQDKAYIIADVSQQGRVMLRNKSFWIDPKAFMSQATWEDIQFRKRESGKPSLGNLRKSLEGIPQMGEATQIFKPNTKTDKHVNRNNNPGPFKVRRPSCIIKGPEKRTRTFF